MISDKTTNSHNPLVTTKGAINRKNDNTKDLNFDTVEN